MKFFYQLLIISFSGLFLSSCALAPGQHLQVSQRGFLEGEQRVLVVSLNSGNLSVLETETSVPEKTSELIQDKIESYRIGAGDLVLVSVQESAFMTSTGFLAEHKEANIRAVEADGSLFYPYVGSIKAAGLTVSELRQLLTERLSRVLIEPQVEVRIATFASQRVTVSGAFVQTQPQFITERPLTLLEAINKAQVNDSIADRSRLLLTREGKNYLINLEAIERNDPSLLQKIYLKNNDIIHLSDGAEKNFFVLGEVPRAGEFRYRKARLTLTEAIGMAGGLRPETSSGKSVYLIRNIHNFSSARDPVIVYQLDLRSPAAFTVASQIVINPQDVVFVGAQEITRWNRFISQLFPSLNFFSTLPRYINP